MQYKDQVEYFLIPKKKEPMHWKQSEKAKSKLTVKIAQSSIPWIHSLLGPKGLGQCQFSVSAICTTSSLSCRIRQVQLYTSWCPWQYLQYSGGPTATKAAPSPVVFSGLSWYQKWNPLSFLFNPAVFMTLKPAQPVRPVRLLHVTKSDFQLEIQPWPTVECSCCVLIWRKYWTEHFTSMMLISC